MQDRAIEIRPVADPELAAAFAVLRELRTDLDESEFRSRLARQREREYELWGAFAPEIVGVLGMRPVESMAWGFHLHVDDLVVTGPARGRGIGKRLLASAEETARSRGMVSLFLDSRPEVIQFYTGTGYAPHSSTLLFKDL